MTPEPTVKPARLPYPVPSSPGRSAIMRAIRRTDTSPERALRSALHRLGLRFRKDLPLAVNGARIRPDVVFTRQRVAVFVDGCFFHRCPEHGHTPATNADYWAPKLARNEARDRANDAALIGAGWMVVRVWEHEDVERAADGIAARVTAIRAVGVRPGS